MTEPRWHGIDPKRYVISNRGEVVDGFHCVVLETSPQLLKSLASRGRRPWNQSYWVSPELDFRVLRHQRAMRGRTATRTDIRYSREGQQGWYASGWTYSEFGNENNSLVEVTEAKVTEHTLNVPVDAEQFNLTFPEGTFVTDVSAKQEYIVRPGGTKRLVTRQELLRGVGYEELLRTETGMAGLARDSGSLLRVLGFVGVGVVAVFLVYVLAKRRAAQTHG